MLLVRHDARCEVSGELEAILTDFCSSVEKGREGFDMRTWCWKLGVVEG